MSPLLHTNVADPVARLAAIHAETKEHKAARSGISARLMTDVTRHIPAGTQLLAARLMMRSEMAGRMTNVCISNVPGPQVPVYMNGARLVTQMGLGPLADRMGLFIAVTSHNGGISFSATSCRRTMPDVDFFMQCMRESFHELQAAAIELTTKPAAKKTTKKTSSKKATIKKTPIKKGVTKKRVSKKKTTKKVAKKVTQKANKISANKPS
jgi:hypothetical protein